MGSGPGALPCPEDLGSGWEGVCGVVGLALTEYSPCGVLEQEHTRTLSVPTVVSQSPSYLFVTPRNPSARKSSLSKASPILTSVLQALMSLFLCGQACHTCHCYSLTQWKPLRSEPGLLPTSPRP